MLSNTGISKQQNNIINGFSKLSKQGKIDKMREVFKNPEKAEEILKSFWHPDPDQQKLFDEFSENTLSNFYFPFGIAPNMVINGKTYIVPMVIEESSVVAAASVSAKFWSSRGGIKATVLSKTKIEQVHFIWKGDFDKLKFHLPELSKELIEGTDHITVNMERRGGGIREIELVDFSDEMENYYQLKVSFDTVDSMGANFINSCLEEFSAILKSYLENNDDFTGEEKKVNIIMAILSNYTPECIVKAEVECDIAEFENADKDMTAEEFVWKFQKAVEIAKIDPHRATTHNKGVFNGIDAVALATGNDFRAMEACGHTYASRSGKYTSLTDLTINNGKFNYSLTIPISVGTVGGLTSLHPLARLSLEMLGNPNAEELMIIIASAGLANNFSAIRSLVTKGIQHGHMKMHLLNILNHFGATEDEKKEAVEFFRDRKVSFAKVAEYIANRKAITRKLKMS